MSEFADYVQKQQIKRPRPGQPAYIEPSDSGYSTQSYSTQSTYTEDHAELDIIDSLNLAETSAHVRLRNLLLDTSEDAEVTLQQLSNLLQSRLLEGHGETLFDLGHEDNGESILFSKEQWDVALDRIRQAANFLKAECKILITRNVGGPEEVDTINDKNKAVSGKIMIRQTPETVEDVIETRIAVVGNGKRDVQYG